FGRARKATCLHDGQERAKVDYVAIDVHTDIFLSRIDGFGMLCTSSDRNNQPINREYRIDVDHASASSQVAVETCMRIRSGAGRAWAFRLAQFMRAPVRLIRAPHGWS